MSATADFLGAPETWGPARLCLDDVHGLWGGRVLYLSGGGALVLQQVPPGRIEARYSLTVPAAEAQAVLALCAAHDVLTVRFPPRPLIPDEANTRLTLVNAAGAPQTVARWAHDPPHTGLAEVLQALHALAVRALETPVQARGPFDAHYRPAWF